MSISRFAQKLIAAALLLAIVAACSDTEKASQSTNTDSLLRYVPADTPYAFVTLETAPDDLVDKLLPQLEASLSAYHRIARAMVENGYADARENDEDVELFEKALPFLDELEELMSVDGFAAAGIDRDSHFAFYGAGLLPVMRVTLSDSALMEATIQRLEDKAGEKMSTSAIDGRSYRFVGDDDLRVILAIIDDNLVVTFLPTSLSEAELKLALGLSLPEENIAGAGTLAAISDKYDLDDYMIGFVDFEKVVSTFVEPQTGVNAELLSFIDYDSDELDDVCKAEISSMASTAPRFVTGYSELSVERIDSLGVLELRQDIASAVANLTAAVPGLGNPQGGLFSFGMSMDLLAWREFYTDQLDAMEENPLACELFADMQAGVESGREILNQPLPPIVYGFKGFLAVVDNIEGMDLMQQQPPTSADMRLLVATDNAEGLLAMGAMFSPDLAALSLEPNGEPVRLEMPQIEALGQVVHVALADNALGLSVGDDMQDGLSDLLQADASKQEPFMFVDMDAATYYEFMSQSTLADSGDLNSVPEIQEAVASMNAAFGELMDRINFAINFTGNGVEIVSEVTLKD